MLNLLAPGSRLCDGITRRQALCAGGLSALGLTMPQLLRSQARASEAGRPTSKAKRCIVLFLMGGPPQHSTWDPKPEAPENIRGPFRPISSSVPGIQFGELMPRLAQQAHRLCVLRAVSTGDNAHSSSGYYMLTGRPHAPMNSENAKPGAPNDWPFLGAVVQALHQEPRTLPTSVRLPMRIFNTDGSVWPGQDSGFLGRKADPWLLRCEPTPAGFRIPDFSLAADVAPDRLDGRQSLLTRVNDRIIQVDRSGTLDRYDRQTHQAFDLLRSASARQAFDLSLEAPSMRERYGLSPFGQSVLLSRRLIEAGVNLVHVNWYRGADEPADNPCWDSHTNEVPRLKEVLLPPMDQAFATLLDDLDQRGILDETLVVCMSEFGRTPRFNPRGGREHWGPVFSIAMAGGGVRGGQVYGASDAIGGEPKDGRVRPEDLTATIFHALGYSADTEVHDSFGRPYAISRGQVIRQVFA
ncbi:MAG: DUF1501 domain-containing protein [Gemmataceae bacterium]|nr:DUF1501 domain-containing protein [Gemmataceae bacterium]